MNLLLWIIGRENLGLPTNILFLQTALNPNSEGVNCHFATVTQLTSEICEDCCVTDSDCGFSLVINK